MNLRKPLQHLINRQLLELGAPSFKMSLPLNSSFSINFLTCRYRMAASLGAEVRIMKAL